MRIGHGFDVHAFGPGDSLMLGGERIPHTHGVKAHSDGDVLLHALCDALLGAAGLGDIGEHFPDSDPAFADASSLDLLAAVMSLLAARGLSVSNADLTLVAQAPRVSAYKPAMRDRIAAALNIDANRVNVKATTTEGLGYLGRAEGVAAHAVVLLDEASV
jgi:2-C-methyl-D-erythritol 2,4-cyclodiphosphate synthase